MSTASEPKPVTNFDAVGEQVARLASVAVAPPDYFAELLAVLEGAMPYRLAAVWGLGERGVVERVAQRNGRLRVASSSQSSKSRILRVLQALKGDAQLLIPSDSEPDSEGTTLLTPVLRGGVPVGVMEVVVGNTVEHLQSTGIASMLERLATAAGDYLTELPSPGNTANAEQADAILSLHRDLSLEAVALSAVNEIRRLFHFDRVSLAIQRRGKYPVLAVSGLDKIAQKAAATVSLANIATLVSSAGETATFGGSHSDSSSPLDAAMAEHASVSGALAMVAVPLRPPASDPNAESPSDVEQPIGVLIAEQFRSSSMHSDPLQESPYLSHLSAALNNALIHSRLASAWPARLVQRYYAKHQQATALRKLAWAGGALLGMGIVGLFPTTYRVQAPGRLLPEVTTAVFASTDATVREILVQGGDDVEQGQLLLRLESEELNTDRLSTESRLHQTRQLLRVMEVELDTRSTGPKDEAYVQLQGRLAQTRIEIDSLEGRMADLLAECERLEVRAPHAGRIATFDPQQLLGDRPVSRGDQLLEVMDFDGEWHLELDCPLGRYGQVQNAWRQSTEPLGMDFVLATYPHRTMQATARRSGNRVEQRTGAGAVVPIEAIVVRDSIPNRAETLAGSDVLARIDCGRKPLAYVLFGSVYDFARRTIW